MICTEDGDGQRDSVDDEIAAEYSLDHRAAAGILLHDPGDCQQQDQNQQYNGNRTEDHQRQGRQVFRFCTVNVVEHEKGEEKPEVQGIQAVHERPVRDFRPDGKITEGQKDDKGCHCIQGNHKAFKHRKNSCPGRTGDCFCTDYNRKRKDPEARKEKNRTPNPPPAYRIL